MQDIASMILQTLANYSEEKETKSDKVTDSIAQYIKCYDVAAAIEARFKAAKRKKEDAKAVLIDYMAGLGTTQLSRAGRTIVHSIRTFGKVTDYDGFIDWVENSSDEPRSQFLEEVIIRGNSKDPRGLYALVLEAQEKSLSTGVPIQKCFPPGIAYSVTDILTMRKSRKSTQSKIAETAVDKLKGLQGEDVL